MRGWQGGTVAPVCYREAFRNLRQTISEFTVRSILPLENQLAIYTVELQSSTAK